MQLTIPNSKGLSAKEATAKFSDALVEMSNEYGFQKTDNVVMTTDNETTFGFKTKLGTKVAGTFSVYGKEDVNVFISTEPKNPPFFSFIVKGLEDGFKKIFE
jgi:hypothetical protein